MPLNTEYDQIHSELLLIRWRRGDGFALEELVRYWEKKLFYYASRLVDNEEDAWDALQDTWVALVQSGSRLREPRSLIMWLYKTTRNNAMNKLRLRYSDRRFLDESESQIRADEDSGELSFKDAQQVHLALGRLSLPHREVLTLFFLLE